MITYLKRIKEGLYECLKVSLVSQMNLTLECLNVKHRVRVGKVTNLGERGIQVNPLSA